MRDNADLMDDILDAQDRQDRIDNAILELVEDMMDDITIVIRPDRNQREQRFYGVEILKHSAREAEMCIGSDSSEDIKEALHAAMVEANNWMDLAARRQLGVR